VGGHLAFVGLRHGSWVRLAVKAALGSTRGFMRWGWPQPEAGVGGGVCVDCELCACVKLHETAAATFFQFLQNVMKKACFLWTRKALSACPLLEKTCGRTRSK